MYSDAQGTVKAEGLFSLFAAAVGNSAATVLFDWHRAYWKVERGFRNRTRQAEPALPILYIV